MDFHALPRRDLQALCKRNGIRANMTNPAMADALAALSTVHGIEEYNKQPTAVPEPASKAVVAEEEVLWEKQGSPLPRGRRVTAKTSEVVKPDQGKGKEEEKADAKRESNREEEAAALGMGRRGPGQRARPAPVAAVPATKVAVEKKGSPPPRTRREPARLNDDVEKVDLKREANKEDAPIQGAVRRGPSRRARTAPSVAASTEVSQIKAAAEEEEKQGRPLPRAHRVTSKPPEPARPDDSVEETEDMKPVANDDDAPVQGVGRRSPSRRARPAPVVPKTGAKVVDEELGSPLPRGRGVNFNANLSPAIRTEGGEEDKNEDMQRETSKGTVRALGVGRRGASRRARLEPAVSAPVDEVPVEKDAPISHGRRGKVKLVEPIMPNGVEEDLKLEEKEEDAPAHSMVQRGPCRRTLPAPSKAPATRRKDATSSIKEQDVPVEAVLVRPTRVRKPTMKAAAATEKKVPRRTTKNAAPRNSTLQNEKQQEEPQEAVPAPLSEEACHDLENVEEAADPQNLEQNEVIEESRQGDVDVLNEEEILMDETPAEKPTVTNEILMEETLTKEPPAIGEECKDKPALEEEQVEAEHRSSPLTGHVDSPILGLVSTFPEQTVEKDEYEDAHFQEGSGPSKGQLDKENHHAVKEMEMVTDIQRALTAAEPSAEVGFTSHTKHGSEMKCSNSLQGTEETTTIDAEDGIVCQESGDVADDVAEAQSKVVDQAAVLDCSGIISSVVEEEKAVETLDSEVVLNEVVISNNLCQVTPIDGKGDLVEKAELVIEKPADPAAEVGFTSHTDHGSEMENSNSLQGTEESTTINAEDGLVCQESGDVADDVAEVQSKVVDEAAVLDCSGNISSVVEQKAVETMDSVVVQNEVVISNNLCDVTVIDGEGDHVEKAELVTEKLTRGSAQSDADVEEDYFQTGFVHSGELKGPVVTEKAETVAEELLQGMATMYEDVGEDNSQNDFILVDEQKLVVDEKAELVTDKLPQDISIMDKDVEQDVIRSVHDDEHKLVGVEKAQRVTEKLPQSPTTMADDVEEDLQIDFGLGKEQKEITTANSVQEITMNGNIVFEKVLITKETQQSATKKDEEDVDDEYLEADFILAEKRKGVATADEGSKLAGIDSEKDEEEKVIEITEEVPQSICVQEDYFEIDVHGDELTKVVTADNVLQVTETEDEDVRKENVFTGDLTSELHVARDYSYHITSSLLDDIIESLSKITITEPAESRNEDIPLCKNSSEKNTAEPLCKNGNEKNTNEPVREDKSEKNTAEAVCKNSSEKNTDEPVREEKSEKNTAEPVCKNSSEKNTDEPVREGKIEENTAEPAAMRENKGVKVSKKSAYLYGLSIAQLRAKLKKTLQRKEAKRVALARVDENVCRSNATGQDHVRKLQQD